MKKRLKKFYDILEKDRKITEFEKRVYKAVFSIPRGRTRSYGWVAERIKSPRSCRAVGNALNKNPYTGTVPCHRVVKSDGSAGGFSRGRRAKIKLLRSEGIDVS